MPFLSWPYIEGESGWGSNTSVYQYVPHYPRARAFPNAEADFGVQILRNGVCYRRVGIDGSLTGVTGLLSYSIYRRIRQYHDQSWLQYILHPHSLVSLISLSHSWHTWDPK